MSDPTTFKTKMRRMMRKLSWILLAVLLLGSVSYYCYRTYTISEGTRTGTLFKVSKKGILFKTYEGQLHLGGSAVMSEISIWDFSVKDEATYQQLQPFDGKQVRCHYKQMVNAFFWQGDTDYIVYKVEGVQ